MKSLLDQLRKRETSPKREEGGREQDEDDDRAE